MYLKATIITRYDEASMIAGEEFLGVTAESRKFTPGDAEAGAAQLRAAVVNNVLGGQIQPGESVEVEVVTEPANIAA